MVDNNKLFNYSVNDVKKLCRFCLIDGNTCIFTKQPNLDGKTISQFFGPAISLKMTRNDGFPGSVCVKCADTVFSIYKYIKSCRTSNSLLREWLNKPRDKDVSKISLTDDHNYSAVKPPLVSMAKNEPYKSINKKLNNHSNDSNKRSIFVFECDYCKKSFDKKSYLRNHINAMHLEKADCGLIICSICGKMIKGVSNLLAHTRNVHKQVKKQCPICLITLSSTRLSKHMLAHDSSSFLCRFCGKVLKSMKSLVSHEKNHSNIRDFICSICGDSFVLKVSLSYHMRKHMNIPPKLYPCELCDKVFRGPHSLKRHTMWHSGKKPFPCSVCDKSFYSATEKKVHMRLHSNPVFSECTYCKKKFLNKSNLRLHIMAHKNIRPHQCDVCGKSFILRSKLSKHTATVHGISAKQEPIWKDPKTYITLNKLMEM